MTTQRDPPLRRGKTMPIRFNCPNCGRAGRLPDGFPGGKIKCPACQTISQVDSGGNTGSDGIGAASVGEPAVSGSVGQPMPGGDTYALEEEAPRPEIKPPPPPPIPKEVKTEKRKPEKSSGVPIAGIVAGAAAGAAVAAGFLFFLFRPSGVGERSDAPPAREAAAEPAPAQGPGEAAQPSVTAAPASGQVVNVAEVQTNAGATQPSTTPVSPLGAARVGRRRDARASRPMPDPAPPANGGPTAGADLAKAVAPGGADQGTNQAADAIKRIQEATVFLKVQAGRARGSGTGFVIRSEGDTVLVATNDHVANPHLEGLPRDDDSARSQPPPMIVAVFRSGAGPGVEQSLRAQIVAADGEENRDLAILQVRGVKNPPEPIALDDAPVPTLLMPVLIYGFPFGNIDMSLNPAVHRNPSITVNRGSVSSMRNDEFNRLAHIQIDGSINPGNSGGPVVDEKGRLVGISVAKIQNTNIGFAIPAAELARMLDGRIGPISLAMRGERGGQADLQVRVRLIDPLNKVQSVEFLYAPAGGGQRPGAGPDADGSWAPLPGAQTVSLNRDGATASGTIQARLNSIRDRRLMVQTAYRLDSGKLVYSMPKPYLVPTRPTGLARAGGAPKAKGVAPTFGLLGPLIDSHKQPVKDCQMQKDANSLTIEVPAGVRLLSHELDVRNAPMTLAEVEGDFVAMVRVAGNMIPGTDPPRFKGRNVLPMTLQGAGL